MNYDILADIEVGAVSKEELLDRLTAASVQLNDYARTLFADPLFTTSAAAYRTRLISISLTELGLPEGGRYDEIVHRAEQIGLTECALEVGPHLRLHHLDQPPGPYLTVASARLRPDDDTHPNGLYLRHLSDGLWLRGYNAGPEVVYPPDFTDFVFSES